MPFRLIEEACHHDRRGRFCSKCGREINPPRLTFKALSAEMSSVWLQKGFRQTALGLLIAPGRQVRRYLEDDRLLLIRPISYLIVVSAFQLWVLSLLSTDRAHLDLQAMGFTQETLQDKVLVSAITWLYGHFYQFALLQAGTVALLLRFVFYRRSGVTLPEYTIMMTYTLSETLLLQGLLALALVPVHTPLPSGLRLAVAMTYNCFAIAQFHGATTPMGLFRAAMAYLAGILVLFVLLVGALFLLEKEAGAIRDEAVKIEQALPKSAP